MTLIFIFFANKLHDGNNYYSSSLPDILKKIGILLFDIKTTENIKTFIVKYIYSKLFVQPDQ